MSSNQSKTAIPVSKIKEKKGKEFQNLIDFLKKTITEESEFFIFCHDNPDPDCMASALGIQNIGKKYGLKTTIIYGGEITHTQNKSMINVMDIKMVRVEDLEEKAKESLEKRLKSDKAILFLIDTSCWNFGNCKSISKFKNIQIESPHIIIDHHERSNINEKSSIDIHRNTGSCSSIVLKILLDIGVPIDSLLATALFLGLMKDTDEMNATHMLDEWDYEANEYLRGKFDFDTYMRIINCPKPRTLINLEGLAKGKYLVQQGNTVISGVGIIKPIYRSLLAEICEDMMSHDQIQKCLIIGISDDGVFGSSKTLVASFRNTGDVIDSDSFIKQIFGKEGSGGRKGAAGASIDLGHVFSMVMDESSEQEREEIFEMVLKTYTKKVLDQIEV